MSLRVCILETDILRPGLIDQYQGYGQMFKRLFSKQPIAAEFVVYNVVQGEYPSDDEVFDAYLVTGSKADSFGTDPWIQTLKTYLLEYPRVTLESSASFLYWQEAQFGLKPTIRINHLVVYQRPDAIVVANKQLYASHYFWTALELRMLVPDPKRGRGFWFVNVNRSRSDGLSGFVGRVIRGRVQSEARKGLESALILTKAALEKQ